jgi:hypothetical protein
VAYRLNPRAHYLHLDVRDPTSCAVAGRVFGLRSVLVNNPALSVIANAGSKWAVRGLAKVATLERSLDICVKSLHPARSTPR